MTSPQVTSQGASARTPVEDASQVVVARALAVRMAQEAGLAPAMTDTVALVATELAENLHRHAWGGELIVVPPPADETNGRLAILAVDRGPGVEQFDACLRDGYSTAGTLGTGLGAVRRLAADFDAVSEPGLGTVVSAGFRAGAGTAVAAHFDVGGVGFPMAGEESNGDGFACVRRGSRLVVLLADGLGHGLRAAEASAAAIAELPALADRTPGALLAALNAGLTRTLGAAVSVVSLQLDVARRGGTLHSSGLGNVSIVIAGLDGSSRRVTTSHGTAGARPAVQTLERESPFPAKGLLIMHTDGLPSRWNLEGRAALLRHRADIVACALWRDFARSSDDSMIVVVRAAVAVQEPA